MKEDKRKVKEKKGDVQYHIYHQHNSCFEEIIQIY